MKIEAFDLKELHKKMEDANIKNLSYIDNAASMPTSNFGGISILVNTSGDGVFAQDIWNSGQSSIQECEIEYDDQCEWAENELTPFIVFDDNKYYLNEFIRNNFR